MRRRPAALVLVLGLLVIGHSLTAYADGGWLDRPLVSWNAPGMAVPAAPAADTTGGNPNCDRSVRPAETAEDRLIVSAGWTLFGTYQSGWNVRIVSAAAGWDGMCRPLSYQDFVFVDGTFAGTIAPAPMDSRTDGAVSRADIEPGGDRVDASFSRYGANDPLCCPSRTTLVMYRIDRQRGVPVLVPDTASTQTNS